MEKVKKCEYKSHKTRLIVVFLTGQYLSLEQDIDEEKWPYDINFEYLHSVKPSGLLRTWYYTPQQRPGSEFEIDVNIKLLENGQEVQNIRTPIVVAEDNIEENDFNELAFLIHDLHSFNFDLIR